MKYTLNIRDIRDQIIRIKLKKRKEFRDNASFFFYPRDSNFQIKEEGKKKREEKSRGSSRHKFPFSSCF